MLHESGAAAIHEQLLNFPSEDAAAMMMMPTGSDGCVPLSC
jgi:hypothetical protein